ncbi:hypothetical protein ARMGADRAFT_1065061 [Armillaria gallica]|uniref:Uncharacterized protein n=1 Tax=Armillaria gallica TaxID=47427 RepID=A0A2H3DLM6_ARMGA|nr:hypothetical protein ARMGADRAFT_1065061 [Armillaria gallica]
MITHLDLKKKPGAEAAKQIINFNRAKEKLGHYLEELPSEKGDWGLTEGPAGMQLADGVCGVISMTGGAVHLYRLVAGILSRLLKTYSSFQLYTHTSCLFIHDNIIHTLCTKHVISYTRPINGRSISSGKDRSHARPYDGTGRWNLEERVPPDGSTSALTGSSVLKNIIYGLVIGSSTTCALPFMLISNSTLSVQLESFPEHMLTRQFTIIDIHTHILLTFALYRSKYSEGEYEIDFDFVEGVHVGERVETVMVRAGSVHARNIEGAGGWEKGGYRFVIAFTVFCDFEAVAPRSLPSKHEANSYTPAIESGILTALSHASILCWTW